MIQGTEEWGPEALVHGRAIPEGSGVKVTWLGTAGFALEHAGTTVLIDPYLTRASIPKLALSKLEPDLRAIAAHAPRADAIILGHTHFDHALDAPVIAKRDGALVLGSRSAAALCRATGVPEAQVRDVERPFGSPPVVVEVGPFRLRFVPSAHSKLALGKVPFPGEIEDCDDVPMRAERYKCGAVFAVEIQVAGRTLVHLGSAEITRPDFEKGEPDLVMLCAAGWTSSRDLPERVTRALSPKAVLLSHWDDFFRPLEREVRVLPAMRVPTLAERLRKASRDTRVGTLPLLGDLRL